MAEPARTPVFPGTTRTMDSTSDAKSKTEAKTGRHGQGKRVFIVDDHPLVRDGFTMAVNEEPDLQVCGEAGDAEQAMRLIPRRKPDIVLVDLSLPGMSGLELIEEIARDYPGLPLLVFSMHNDPGNALRALRAGARGYVTKDSKIESVIAAIRSVLANETYVSEQLKTEMLNKVLACEEDAEAAPRAADLLTKRELEIFELIGRGMTMRQIARNLFLSVRTVECHRDHIRGKMGASSTVELQHKAFEWGHQES
jgi:DNA-binding NarL/FixJ family response regulator